MLQAPILLFLHGVGGDPDDRWQDALEVALTRLGYPDLSGIKVLAPKYPNGLNGVDDDEPLPKVTVRRPRGDDAERNRRDFERRRTAMEVLLGPDDRGEGLLGGDHIAPVAADMKRFQQAKNYTEDPKIRAWVLQRILKKLPESGRLVIVGHSLGSVIAADLLRRLPPGLEVAGMVTIGSPLAHKTFHVERLRDLLVEPPVNLAWWVNFWSTADLVPTRRGISAAFPWVLDQRIRTSSGLHPRQAHQATTYLQSDTVAMAIGRGLFGSRSKEIARVESSLEIQLDYPETIALLALRYAHLTMKELEGDTRHRYADALRQIQATTVEQIRARNTNESRPMPTVIANLAVDLSDPRSRPHEPGTPGHLSITEAVVPLAAIAAGNVLQPFEIEVAKEKRQRAMEQLTLEMGLGSQLGSNVFGAVDRSRKVLKGPTNWVKWAALSLGAAAVVAATSGLALAAAPGVAGAAAVTSALAAFGPGGMIGGLLTAGTLVTAGGSGLAIGLAAPGTTAATVEAVVAAQLTMAILRELQGISQDPKTWSTLVEAEAHMARQLARLKPVSDESAPTLKELQRKLDAIDRALEYLHSHDLEPKHLELLADEV